MSNLSHWDVCMPKTTSFFNYLKFSSIFNVNIDFPFANTMYGSKQNKIFEFS